MEASEGGVVDCTGSEFSFVVVSGEAATGSAASGAAAPGAAASERKQVAMGRRSGLAR